MTSLIVLILISIATGGSAIKAVEVLLSHGVPENRIIFINLVRPISYFLKDFLTNSWKDFLSRGPPELLFEISTTTSNYWLD